jgi:hypothetical protein
MAKLTVEEVTEITETAQRERLASVRDFLVGTIKAVTTDLPGFLMDVADKIAGDTSVLGEKDRSSQAFEKLTGIKSTGSVEEMVGGMVNPAMIVPAFLTKTVGAMKAAQLANKALPDQQVFKMFGMFKSPSDDILRTVISDKGASLKMGVPKGPKLLRGETMVLSPSPGAHSLTVGDILDHPDLFSVMPELRDVRVKGMFGAKGGGSFNPETGMIRLGDADSEQEMLSTLLHEVQHSIQNNFGMTGGGNLGMFIDDPDFLKAAQKRLANVVNQQAERTQKSVGGSSEVTMMAMDARRELRKAEEKAFSMYKAIAGEEEARAVQKLLANPSLASKVPTSYYDTPLTDIIVDPLTAPKVTDDPKVRAILDYMASNPEFGK